MRRRISSFCNTVDIENKGRNQGFSSSPTPDSYSGIQLFSNPNTSFHFFSKLISDSYYARIFFPTGTVAFHLFQLISTLIHNSDSESTSSLLCTPVFPLILHRHFRECIKQANGRKPLFYFELVTINTLFIFSVQSTLTPDSDSNLQFFQL